MKKDIFSAWIKEFCSLVFTQAVQAFLLAIIMSVILYMTSAGNQLNSSYSEEQVQATSIMAIIALTSISKIELLVKKIFGVESQYGDPALRNGAKTFSSGLAAGFATVTLGKKLLDNPKKIAGGIGGFVRSQNQIARIKQRKARDLNNLDLQKPENKNNNDNNGNNNSPQQSGNPQPGTNPGYDPTSRERRRTYTVEETDPEKLDDQIKYYKDMIKDAKGRLNNGRGISNKERDKITKNIENYENKLKELENQRDSIRNRDTTGGVPTAPGTSVVVDGKNIGPSNVTLSPQNISIQSADIGTAAKISATGNNDIRSVQNIDTNGNTNINPTTQATWAEKMNNLNDKYNDMLRDAKEKRGQAVKSVVSGVTETAGASAGLLAGATGKTIIDLAQGDASLKNTLSAGVQGAGTGDIVGSTLVNAVDALKNVAKGVGKVVETHEIRKETINTVTRVEERNGLNRTDSGMLKYKRSMDELNNYAKSKEIADNNARQIRKKADVDHI